MVPNIERPITVLVVDDDFDFVELVALQLENYEEGTAFQVYVAADGVEAMAQIAALQRVDALITDLNMPGADGLAVALAFRARFPKRPILLMTASEMADERIASLLKIPQTAVLRKPFLISALLEKLQKAQAEWMHPGDRMYLRMKPESPKLVMVVEDEEILRRSIARALERRGYIVSQFADALNAWRNLESASEAPFALITDFTMPQLTGADLLQRVIGAKISIPILVLMSANSPIWTNVLRDENGVFQLEKPFSIDRLMEILESLDGPEAN